MKKLVISFLCIMLCSSMALADGIPANSKYGISLYKQGNYLGCSQEMERITMMDPTNTVAHYYLAISYVQINQKDKAIEEYKKIIALDPKSQVADNAKKGLMLLGLKPEEIATIINSVSPPTLPIPDVKLSNPFVDNFMTEKAKDFMTEKSLNRVINSVNQSTPVDPETYKQFDDFSKKKSDNSTPTADEIAQAIKTLQKAGINPLSTNQAMNPEAMQMNMLMSSFGGNNNNNMSGMNNMLPLLMMSQGQQNGQNIDPQLMQTYISGMLMPNMFSSLENQNNNNNN